MKSFKKVAQEVEAGWLSYCETNDDTQFTDALQEWATKSARVAERKGVCHDSDFSDLRQEYILRFLETRDGNGMTIGARLRHCVADVNAAYNPASAAVNVPRRRSSTQEEAAGVNVRLDRGVGMVEMRPSEFRDDLYATKCIMLQNAETQDEINAILKALQDADPKYLDIWNKCIELDGDPVAIRREYGDYQGNKMLETLRVFLTTRTNIVEPNTVVRGYNA